MLGILIALVVILGLIGLVAICEEVYGLGIPLSILAGVALALCFSPLGKLSLTGDSGGTDYGFITAVDEESFGTYKVYLRRPMAAELLGANGGQLIQGAGTPDEEKEIKYCANPDIDQAVLESLKSNIGSKNMVRITYARIKPMTFHEKFFGECWSSPVVGVEVVENE